MPGDGNRRAAWGGSPSATSEAVHLPSLLAKLDVEDETDLLEVVRTVRDAVEDEPRRYVPTVPKLRQLLDRPTAREPIAELVVETLAELAAEAPDDVAPSVETVVRFARAETPHPGTTHALRALTHVAEKRPGAVVDHVDDVVAIIEADDGFDPWGTRFFATLSTGSPRAIEPAVPILETALERDPETHGTDALAGLARLVRVESSTVPTFLDAVGVLIRRGDPTQRTEAVDRLTEAVRADPAAFGGAGGVAESILEALVESDSSADVRDRVETVLATIRRAEVRNS